VSETTAYGFQRNLVCGAPGAVGGWLFSIAQRKIISA
jgi:hypothetical protein